MTHTEKVKKIRDITMSPMNRINEALKASNDDVDAAIKWLLANKVNSGADLSNRFANNAIIHSYVHNHKIGAMIILACQTDFVAKNELFLNLAKDICMHIVSSSTAEFVDIDSVPYATLEIINTFYREEVEREHLKKPTDVKQKIAQGKINKKLNEVCLLSQPFVKDPAITVGDLINRVAATVGEKIVVKKFIRMTYDANAWREDGLK